MTCDSRRIIRTRQVRANGIKQRLHSFILKRRTANHRIDLHVNRTLTDGHTKFIFRNRRRIVKIFFHDRVVTFGYGFKHFIAPFLRFSQKSGRNVFDLILSAHRFIAPIDSLHGHEINHAFKVFFGADRYLNRTRRCSQHVTHLTNHFKKVRSRAVHLVYVTDTRNIIFIGLAPHRLRLRLHSTHSTKCGHRSVKDAQRTFYFNCKVDVPGGVYQVNFKSLIVVIPECCRCGGSNGNSPLLLLLHPVHRSGTVMHFSDFMRQTGIKQNTFRCSRFSRVNMGHNTDITCIFQYCICLAHRLLLIKH